MSRTQRPLAQSLSEAARSLARVLSAPVLLGALVLPVSYVPVAMLLLLHMLLGPGR